MVPEATVTQAMVDVLLDSKNGNGVFCVLHQQFS
jgi:hypothetical protein